MQAPEDQNAQRCAGAANYAQEGEHRQKSKKHKHGFSKDSKVDGELKPGHLYINWRGLA